MKSDYQVDEETRFRLYKKEQWHFCALQLGWFTIVVFLTSMFELLIFCVSFYGSDKESSDPGALLLFLQKFQFQCALDSKSVWFIEGTTLSMTLFKLHFIVIFMYTTLFMIVLFKIPFKYDRI